MMKREVIAEKLKVMDDKVILETFARKLKNLFFRNKPMTYFEVAKIINTVGFNGAFIATCNQYDKKLFRLKRLVDGMAKDDYEEFCYQLVTLMVMNGVIDDKF